MRRVAVLGAGPSGLATARRLKEAGYEVTVFERSHQLGGTWCYTGEAWMAEDGKPVYSSMYENLVTNLPKELMTFPDFPFHDVDVSYVPSEEILKYLSSFSDTYDIRNLIKFQHHVDVVSPCDSGWSIQVTDLKTQTVHSFKYEAVAVCTGQFWCPRYPVVEGRDLFRGRQTHSHEFRRPDPFKNRRVLIVGGGASGLDLALNISLVAKQVCVSRREFNTIVGLFPDNVTEKPMLVSLSEYTAIFDDGTSTEVDDIVYCTGFRYRYPFLSPECGVTVDKKYVHPLYQQVVNISRPTMAFIGVPYYACPSVMFDLQAQLFVAVLDGRCKLPDAETMRKDEAEDAERQRACGFLPHYLPNRQEEYFQTLTVLAGAEPLPPYYVKMFNDVAFDFTKNIQHYRKNKYRIVDCENYEKI